MRKRKQTTLSTIVVIIFVIITLFFQMFVIEQHDEGYLPNNTQLHEKDYVHAYCKGEEEHVLPDKTRIDCLTTTHACEFDWAKKWYEGFTQALWYAHNTGKKPCLVLILKSQQDYKYYNRAKILSDKYDVKLIEVKAKEFE